MVHRGEDERQVGRLALQAPASRRSTTSRSADRVSRTVESALTHFIAADLLIMSC